MTMIMTKATMDNFLKNGKGLLLAYDQGFEHGPSTDFNEKNIDPNYVLDIAVKGQFTGVVLHKGIAEKYYNSKYSVDQTSFKWAVKAAGLTKVFMSGGPKAPTDETFLNQVKGAMDAGATGLAVGRNVWQHTDPLKMSSALREIIFNGKEVDRALQMVVAE